MIVGLILNTQKETISVSHIVMFAEKTYNAFEPVGHTKRRKERESTHSIFVICFRARIAVIPKVFIV